MKYHPQLATAITKVVPIFGTLPDIVSTCYSTVQEHGENIFPHKNIDIDYLC